MNKNQKEKTNNNIDISENDKEPIKKEIEIIEREGSPEDLAHLYSKLAKATGELINVEKNGKNDYHNYKYAKADDIYLEVSRVLSEYNVAVLTFPVDKKVSKFKNSKGNIVIGIFLEKYFSFNCGDTGAHIGMRYWGYDRGQGDKFLYKAYTGAMKYFLRDNFMIDTGDPDDPEFGKHEDDVMPTENMNSGNKLKNRNKSSKDSSTEPKQSSKTSEENKESNYAKIMRLYKKDKYKNIVRDCVQDFLVKMSNDDISKDEVNFKDINDYSDKQLNYILEEIEKRAENKN